ncbi:MAG: hypothetical protein M9891_13260, partial [Austwickia sp.]|nr:hypothetical protein [Austwickia sp.]
MSRRPRPLRAGSVIMALFLLIVLGLGTAIAQVERAAYIANQPSPPAQRPCPRHRRLGQRGSHT